MSARRMAEATTSPILDRRIVPATNEPLLAGGLRIPRDGNHELAIDGRRIALTNLDRRLYPDAAFTKADSIAYHLALANELLAVLKDRALTVGRFPGGVDGRGFAQSELPGRPAWVRTVPITLAKGGEKRFTLVDERATLVWLAQMGVIELHTFLGRAHDLEHPTDILFDLDPSAPAGLVEAADVALLLLDRLTRLGHAPRVKTSGSVGLHVLIPASPGSTHVETRAFAAQVASELAKERPELVSDRMERAARIGRVLVDVRQNAMRLTTVAAYSLRSTPRPTVSTPITWDEVRAACATRDASSLVFLASDVMRRVQAI
jgi:bifunctional non-homologous end joining protein LigD